MVRAVKAIWRFLVGLARWPWGGPRKRWPYMIAVDRARNEHEDSAVVGVSRNPATGKYYVFYAKSCGPDEDVCKLEVEAEAAARKWEKGEL